MHSKKKGILKQCLLLGVFLIMPALLQGCIPIILAAAAGGVYVAVDEDAQQNVTSWLTKVKKDFKNTKISGEKEAKKSIGHQEGSVLAVEINSFAVSPLKVKRGSSIAVNLQYAVAGAEQSKGILVTTQQDLIFDGAEIITLDSQKVIWENGVWEQSSSFMVPASAKLGKYKVKQSIISKGNTLQAFAFFTVIQQKAVKEL